MSRVDTNQTDRKISRRAIDELELYDIDDVPIIGGLKILPDGLVTQLGNIDSEGDTVHLSPNTILKNKDIRKTWNHDGFLAFSHFGLSNTEARIQELNITMQGDDSEIIKSVSGRIRLLENQFTHNGTGGKERLGEFTSNPLVAIINNSPSSGFGIGWVLRNVAIGVFIGNQMLPRAGTVGTHYDVHGIMFGGEISGNAFDTKALQYAMHISDLITGLTISGNSLIGTKLAFKPDGDGDIASFTDSPANTLTNSNAVGLPENQYIIQNPPSGYNIGDSVLFDNTWTVLSNRGNKIISPRGFALPIFYTDPPSVITIGDSGFTKLNQTTVNNVLPHGFLIGSKQQIKITSTIGIYNTTFTATITSATAFTIPVAFNGTNGTSTWTHGSINETDPRLEVVNNRGMRNGMITAEGHLNVIGSELDITFTATNQPKKLGATTFIAQNVERGLLAIDGNYEFLSEEPSDIQVSFSALMEKLTGGATNIGLGLFKNGIAIPNFKYARSVNSGVTQVSGVRTIPMTKNDDLDLVVINSGDTNTIQVSTADIIIIGV